MRKRDRLWRVAGICLGIALLFLHPVSRKLIMWLLPLGSGYDDLIGIVALLFAGLAAFSYIWTGIPEFWRRWKK